MTVKVLATLFRFAILRGYDVMQDGIRLKASYIDFL